MNIGSTYRMFELLKDSSYRDSTVFLFIVLLFWRIALYYSFLIFVFCVRYEAINAAINAY